jgi:translation initiation factor IF-3
MELALAVLKRMKEDMLDIAKTEQDISPEGKQALMVMIPLK